MSNSFGSLFKFTTFGESHGPAIGCIVDGVPAGLKIDLEFIQKELDRRKPGQNRFSTQRKEDDNVEILSGVFDGISTGMPISLLIRNTDQKSKDYSNIKDLFRPGHADYTYFKKYGIRDYRGGGRSSARETAARVAAGAIAKTLLSELSINVFSGVRSIGNVVSQKNDFNNALISDIYSLDPDVEEKQKELIDIARNEHDSIGGSVYVKVCNVPVGLGEPIYNKLDSKIADAMMGINAVKAVEIGVGSKASLLNGSENNDLMSCSGFLSNNSGGILGGISNGEDIEATIYFKPTPSIFKNQKTLDINGKEINCTLKGRHDPCVAIRGSIVAESMMAIVLADMVLLNLASNIKNIKKVYLNV